MLNTDIPCSLFSLIRPVCPSEMGAFYFTVIGISHFAVTLIFYSLDLYVGQGIPYYRFLCMICRPGVEQEVTRV